MRNYPLPKIDDIRFLPPADSYEQKRDDFCRLLRELPAGLTQFVCHPAIASPGLERLANDWQQRVWVNQLLADEAVQQTMAEQQIHTTNWREIMRRFEGVPEAPAADEVTHE